jgi:hypothetical protein
VLEQELLEGQRPGFAKVDGYEARSTRAYLEAMRDAAQSGAGVPGEADARGER